PALVPPPEPEPVPAPPAAPECERGRVGVGVAVRPPFGADTPWRLEPELTGALLFGHLELAASAGAAWPAKRTIPMTAGAGDLTLLAFPVRVAAGWVVPI